MLWSSGGTAWMGSTSQLRLTILPNTSFHTQAVLNPRRAIGLRSCLGFLLSGSSNGLAGIMFLGFCTGILIYKKKNFTSFGQPNKADHLCQLWQSSSNLLVDHVCVWMCQCQKGPQYPLTKSCCQPTVCAYEWRCPIVKWHLIVYCR